MLLFALLACQSPAGPAAAKAPVDTAIDDDSAAPADDSGADTADPVPPPPCSPIANLELVPLDAWAQDLGGVTLLADPAPRTLALAEAGPGVVAIPFGDEALTLSVRLSAADHRDLRLDIAYDGAGGFVPTTPAEGRIATSAGTLSLDGVDCPLFTVYAGLDHAWFAAAGAPPTQNAVTLHMDGESQWAAVAAALAATTRRVTWSTWWWESDFELLREAGPTTLDEDARWPNTAMGMFEALPGVERRLLINRFWDENADWTEYLNTDTPLRDAAEAAGDGLEVVLQGNDTEVDLFEAYTGEAAAYDFGARVLQNPRYADRAVALAPPPPVPVGLTAQVASWHQKSMVFDGLVAFVSGMNTKGTDWDSSAHLVHDARRMAFDATDDERADVAAGLALPDLGPRKDYGVELHGPAAQTVEAILQSRWDAAQTDGSLYADRATPFDLDPPAAAPADGVPVQVVATMPAPWSTMDIAETHARAFSQATQYIYIEDQYFRAPLLLDAIIDAMLDQPELVLIVVTNDVAMTEGGAKYTSLADQSLRALFPDRYLLLQLAAADLFTEEGWFWDTVEVELLPMDTHSKLRLVDDRYLSVGSCNFNNRGYLYEGELDVAILDTPTATDARRRIFDNLVGPALAPLLSDDPRNNLDVLAVAAANNADRLAWWEAEGVDLNAEEAEAAWAADPLDGFVLPLSIEADYEWDVGPDAF